MNLWCSSVCFIGARRQLQASERHVLDGCAEAYMTVRWAWREVVGACRGTYDVTAE